MTCNLGLIWTTRCPFCPDLLSPPSAVAWPAPLLRLFLHFTFGGRVLHSCVTVWLIKSVHRHLNTWQSAAKKGLFFQKVYFSCYETLSLGPHSAVMTQTAAMLLQLLPSLGNAFRHH